LIASTGANASLIKISPRTVFTNGSDTSALLDIGVGASGSETVIVENIGIGGNHNLANSPLLEYAVPIQIPSGTRISARIQSVISGGRTAGILTRVYDMGDYATAPTTVDTIGADTSTSQGTNMSGSSGTYVQIIASTSRAYRAVIIAPNISANGTATVLVTYTLATGGSGSEVDVAARSFNYSDAEFVYDGGNSSSTLIAENVPAGTRLSVKHNIAANPSRYGVTLIGIP
jgi:hypothetical protein